MSDARLELLSYERSPLIYTNNEANSTDGLALCMAQSRGSQNGAAVKVVLRIMDFSSIQYTILDLARMKEIFARHERRQLGVHRARWKGIRGDADCQYLERGIFGRTVKSR